jgi:DNA-binding protein H-NS
MARRTSIESLNKKIAALELQKKKLLTVEKPGIAQVRKLVVKFKLSAADLKAVFGKKTKNQAKGQKKSRRKSSLAGKKVAAKYRDASGNSWTGRGRVPKWIQEAEKAGHKRDEFLIKR